MAQMVAITNKNVKYGGSIIPKDTKVYGDEAEQLVGMGHADLDQVQALASVQETLRNETDRCVEKVEEEAAKRAVVQAKIDKRAKAKGRQRRDKVLSESKPEYKQLAIEAAKEVSGA